IYLRDRDIWTIQIGLQSFVSQYNAEYALIMTGSVLSVVPIALIFLLGQRFFVQGIATAGMKGRADGPHTSPLRGRLAHRIRDRIPSGGDDADAHTGR